MNIQNVIGKIKIGAKRNAPELLLGAGLVTGTACVITASKATVKASELKRDLDDLKCDIVTDLELGKLDDDGMKQEVLRVYRKYALDLLKTYAIPVGLYASTVALIFSSYKTQKNRQIALSTALTACTTAYSTLVTKLKEGAANDLTAEEVLNGVEVKTRVDEDGCIITEKVQGDPIGTSIYKARFDRYATAWALDRYQNISTLRSEECWANDRLQLQGYLFLNDVYDRLGLPRTKEGQIVGWSAKGDGDGYVSFGMVDCNTYDDVRYDDNAFDLEFNVDGDILTKFQ